MSDSRQLIEVLTKRFADLEAQDVRSRSLADMKDVLLILEELTYNACRGKERSQQRGRSEIASLFEQVEVGLVEQTATFYRAFVAQHKAIASQRPISAERFLLFLLPKSEREHKLGDLREDFVNIADVHGMAFARQCYWRQAVGVVLASWFDRLLNAAERVAAVWKQLS
jgi:hypothetical protein